MKTGIHLRRGKMVSKTNLNVLLKNLEGFVKDVPINPKSPKRRAWERNRIEMKEALKTTYEILAKGGNLEGLAVFIGPMRDCRKVLSKQVLIAKLPDVIHEAAGRKYKNKGWLQTLKKMR